MFVHFKKAFTSLRHSFERRAYWLLLCFESYQGIPYSGTGGKYRGWWTLYWWLTLILYMSEVKRINLCCLLIFIYVRKKIENCGWYLQQAGNKLLNIFFHRCSHKISCFSELARNSSVLVLIFWTASEALTP